MDHNDDDEGLGLGQVWAFHPRKSLEKPINVPNSAPATQ